MWSENEVKVKITETINKSIWQNTAGTLAGSKAYLASWINLNSKKIPASKTKVDIIVEFKNVHPVLSTGSIEIRFDSAYTKIYNHCKSVLVLKSYL